MKTGRPECITSAVSCAPSTTRPGTSARTASSRCSSASVPGRPTAQTRQHCAHTFTNASADRAKCVFSCCLSDFKPLCCLCAIWSQGPFVAPLDRAPGRLPNHGSDVRGRCVDQGPIAGKLSDTSATDSAGVQHHPGGVARQRCWYLKPNPLHTSCTWPQRPLGTTNKNILILLYAGTDLNKRHFLAYFKATVTSAIYQVQWAFQDMLLFLPSTTLPLDVENMFSIANHDFHVIDLLVL